MPQRSKSYAPRPAARYSNSPPPYTANHDPLIALLAAAIPKPNRGHHAQLWYDSSSNAWEPSLIWICLTQTNLRRTLAFTYPNSPKLELLSASSSNFTLLVWIDARC